MKPIRKLIFADGAEAFVQGGISIQANKQSPISNEEVKEVEPHIENIFKENK